MQACSRCGASFQHGGTRQRHELSCWTPYTLERLFEIGRVDTRNRRKCWAWTTPQSGVELTGTFRPRVVNPRTGKRDYVARVILEYYFNELMPPGQRALHDCDTLWCVNPAHLYMGDAKQNTDDMFSRGRRVSTPEQRADQSARTKQQWAERTPEERRRVGRAISEAKRRNLKSE